MTYKLQYSPKAIKQLNKLDRNTHAYIKSWMSKHINNCDNPRIHGKNLVKHHKGNWRYKMGRYRVICEIIDNELLVYAVMVGHRRNVYKK